MTNWRRIWIAFIFLHAPAYPQEIYDGYDAYYQTLENKIFKNSSRPFEGIKKNTIAWHSHRIHLTAARVFPGEFVINDDLGSRPLAYETPSLVCIEGTASSSSGTAVRHKSVYLIELKNKNKTTLYKLPSLFASCLAIHSDSTGRILFYKANYTYEDGGDLPTGTILTEYAIDQCRFKPTQHSITTHFIEAENVWKFTIKSKM